MPDDQHPADLPAARGEVTALEPTRAQQTLARRVAESRATVPDVTLRADVDMERCLAALAGRDSLPSIQDAVIKASALALREHPRANSRYRDGRFEHLGRVNVGFAVHAHEALYVPTIFDADSKPLDEIARETRALSDRVERKTITQPELGGATFTVLVLDGPVAVDPVIHPPHAAALGAGGVTDRAVVRDRKPVAAPAMTLALACDHRILHGVEAAAFLTRIRDLLEESAGLFG